MPVSLTPPDIVRTVGAAAPGDFPASILEENLKQLQDFLARFNIDRDFTNFLKDTENVHNLADLQDCIQKYKSIITQMVPIDGLSQWKKILWDRFIKTTSTSTDRSNFLKLLQILKESEIENGVYLQIQGRDLLQEMQDNDNEYRRQYTEINDQYKNGILEKRVRETKITEVRDIRWQNNKMVGDFFTRI